MRNFVLVSAIVLGNACAKTPATTRSVQIEATLPSGMPPSAQLFIAVYSPEEIAAKMPQDPARLFDVMGRIVGVSDQDDRDDVVAFKVEVPAADAVVHVFYDAANHGLEALFGPRPGLAQGFVEVPAAAANVALALQGSPPAPPEESCRRERQTLLVLDAPETARPGDTGERRVCVQVPASYADGDQRYPVVFALPGFSGFHANNDAWRARSSFDEAAAEVGVEAIYVGVATRVVEGTSYFASSPRFGDWDAYFAHRLVPEIDQRFRTNGRRATVGHSTGGWNAIHLGIAHPELVHVVGASSPDPLDFEDWLRDGAQLKPRWLAWLRAEEAMGGRGQFVSWAAAWSPDPTAPRGFRWPADVVSGAIDETVYASWQAHSPFARLHSDAGRAGGAQLSGKLVITAGRTDEFDLFHPTARYVEALTAAGVEVAWLPTDLGHFGGDQDRWGPLARFVLRALREPPTR